MKVGHPQIMVLIAALMMTVGCTTTMDTAPPRPGPGPGPGPGECDDAPAELPRPEPLQWKRVNALQSDLMTALSLGANELCRELESVPCAAVHKLPLGGSDPIGSSLYEAAAEPVATTPMAIDRMVLGSCIERVRRDVVGPAVVFTRLDLSSARLDLAEPAAREAARGDVNDLFRRFLARAATSGGRDCARGLLLAFVLAFPFGRPAPRCGSSQCTSRFSLPRRPCRTRSSRRCPRAGAITGFATRNPVKACV